VRRLRADWQLALIPLGLTLVAHGVAHLQASIEARSAQLGDLDARLAERREQLATLDGQAEGVNATLTVAET